MRGDKRGLVGWIILGIIGFIILVLLLAGFYLYNYYVFETVRICIGEEHDVLYTCETSEDCFEATGNIDIISSLDGAPEFIAGTFNEMLDTAIYCNQTCFVREVRGINPETQQLERLDNCYDNEDEIVVEVRGKDAWEVYSWMKSQTE